VIYKGILGKSLNFWGQSVAGRPHFIAAGPAPGPFSTWSFPVAFYSLRDQRSYYGMVKFQGKEGFSPFKSFNSSPSPSLLFQSSCSSSPLPWIPSVLCPPLPPQGTSHQGHVGCFGCINRLTEGLRCCKGGQWRSRRAIGEDGWPAGQLPWPTGRPTPLTDRPWFVANRSPMLRADHHQRGKVPPVLEVVERA
jgi:hypothetical protein